MEKSNNVREFKSELRRFRNSSIISYLYFVLLIMPGFVLYGTFQPDFEMLYQITLYSGLNLIFVTIIPLIFHLIVLFYGMKVLSCHSLVLRNLWKLSLIFLSLRVVVEPIHYILLAHGIDWGLITSESEMIQLAFFSNLDLLIFQVIYMISILGITITFSSLLILLQKKYALQYFRKTGILYLFLIGYFLYQLFFLIGIDILEPTWSINPLLIGSLFSYYSFLSLGDGFLNINRGNLEKIINQTT